MADRTQGPRDLTAGRLVEACREGSADAWDELVRRFERLVYSIARREGLTPDDAADITQLTFESLLEQLDRIRDPDQISYWLMSVARRQSWRARSHRGPAVGAGPCSTGSDEPAPDGDLLRSEERLWLYDALTQLDAPCRTVIDALYFAPVPMTYSELALALDRPVGSIGPIRARCLERLRRIMEDRL